MFHQFNTLIDILYFEYFVNFEYFINIEFHTQTKRKEHFLKFQLRINEEENVYLN